MYLVFTPIPGQVPCIYSHARPGESWNYLEFEDVPVVEFMYLVFTPMPGQVRVGITLNLRMYLWWSLCTLYLLPCQAM